ncbi:MAG: tetratricopeptide repeat protein [Limisphaerales bacterium]
MADNKRKKVSQMLPISPWLLAGLVVAILFIALFLIPTQKRNIEQNKIDQEWGKAYAGLQDLSPEERAERAEYYDFLEVYLRRRLLDPADAEGHETVLKDAVKVGEKHGFTKALQIEIEQLILRSPGTLETYRILEPHLVNLPDDTRDTLMIRFADRALADERADVALEIYTPYWEANQGDINVLSKYMDIAGSHAGRQDLAVRALEVYEARLAEPLHVHNRELALRRVKLLEQSNQPAAAARQMELIYDAADEETKRELHPDYKRLLGYVNQEHKLLPIMIQKAEQNPNNPVIWRELAEMAKRLSDQQLELKARTRVVMLAPRDGLSALRLGDLLQWNNRPNIAFEAYVLALDRGVDQALEPVVKLNKGGLFRNVELFQAMERMGERLNLRVYGTNMAQLAANLSDFRKAQFYYDKVLEYRGEDPAILAEYGLMMLDIGRHEEAISIYSRAAASGGDNFKVMVSIAEAQFRAGQFEAALKTYRELLRMKPHRRQLENYLRLAESMGRIEEAAGVLWTFMQNSGEAERKDYEKLAYYNGVLGRKEALETTLREAFQKFPEDPLLRKQLLYAYSDNKRNAQAAALLATDVGACRELLFGRTNEDKKLGRAGRITTIMNPAETANALVSILENPETVLRMAKAARERTEKFYTMSQMLDSYRKLYKGKAVEEGLEPRSDRPAVINFKSRRSPRRAPTTR